MSIFGKSYGHHITGTARLHGKPIEVGTVGHAVKSGLAYVTEDRKSLGLILEDHITNNITLANLPGVSKFGVLDSHAERQVALDYRKRMNIRCSSVYQK